MIPLRPLLPRDPDNLPDAPEDGSALPTWEDDRDYLADHWKDRYYEGPEMTEAQMIDIDEFEKCALQFQGRFWMTLRVDNVLAFIAEIRRLRRESEMLHQIVDDAIAMAAHRRTGLLGPEVVAHRKCPCGGLGGIKKMHGKYWAECNNCECSTDTLDTPEEAWAAWDGVE